MAGRRPEPEDRAWSGPGPPPHSDTTFSPLLHSRPKTSFNWFVNPLKTFVFFIWRRYWRVLLLLLVLALITVFLLLVFYTMPGQISQLIFRPLHHPPPGSN